MIDARLIVGMLLTSLLLTATCQTVQAQGNDNVGSTFGEGKVFYQSAVLPKLAENGCFKCHARGYVRPNLSYESMIRRLAIGDSAENNAVIYKIANVRSISPGMPNHPGGQRCVTIDAEPCKIVRQWWAIEFGQERADK